MKICVYAMCKNEEQFVGSWMDSMSEADYVVVLDTGSTDNTVEKLKARGSLEEKIQFLTSQNNAMQKQFGFFYD